MSLYIFSLLHIQTVVNSSAPMSLYSFSLLHIQTVVNSSAPMILYSFRCTFNNTGEHTYVRTLSVNGPVSLSAFTAANSQCLLLLTMTLLTLSLFATAKAVTPVTLSAFTAVVSDTCRFVITHHNPVVQC